MRPVLDLMASHGSQWAVLQSVAERIGGIRTRFTAGWRQHERDAGQRQFTAARPNQLWVADLTYVATWRGWSTSPL